MNLRLVEAGAGDLGDLEALFSTCAPCRECGCMNHREAPDRAPTGPEAIRALGARFGAGRAFGVLAYDGDACVGWGAVDPAVELPGHDAFVDRRPDTGSWAIHCLVVAATHRGRGLSGRLVEAAIDLARARGATEVLAFPIPAETRGRFPEHEAEFSGRASTYARLGFRPRRRIGDFYEEVVLSL